MSDAYARDTTLVGADSRLYDRALDGVVALTVVGFALALMGIVQVVELAASGAALGESLLAVLAVTAGGVGVVAAFSWANVVPITSERVRGVAVGLVVSLVALTAVAYATGVTLASMLGWVLLFEAAVIVVAGVASRAGVVETTPDASAGLVAGFAFGVVGLALGAAVGGSLLGAGAVAWLAPAVVVGVALAALTILPREDVGSTLPAALVVGALGATIASAVLGVGWQWNPQAVSGGFTGGIVIPLFVLTGSLLSAWSAAKAREGFGAQGRQYGTFLVIDLNALMMLVVMAAIVVFVTIKGAGYAFHGFQVGAASALLATLPLLVLTVRRAKRPAGSPEWRSGARQLLRVLPLSAAGALAALFAYVAVTGRRLAYDFTYTVQVNRQPEVLDTSVAVTRSLVVGTPLVLVVGVALFAYFFRRYGSLDNVGEEFQSVARVRRAVPLVVGALVVLAAAFGVLGANPFGLTVLGETIAYWIVVAAAVAAMALAVAPLAAVLAGGDPAAVGERAVRFAPLVVVGALGGVSVLLASAFLESTARTVPNVSGVPVVAFAAFVAGLASLALAALTVAGARGVDETITERLLGEETTLSLAAAAGYVVVLGVHVAGTGVPFRVGPAAVATTGSLSWPMAMQAYIPLGVDPGGIFPAIVGTVWLVVGATAFAVPLGLGAAVFLTEYAEQGNFTNLVEIATNALWSTPSIVFGLFGAAFLIPRLGGDESLLAGMLVLGFMLLPLVLITSREAIKAVPAEYRDASAALGVDQWTTIRSVVVPAAMPGVITGVILGVGRIAGETAPLILVLGSTLNATEAVDVVGGFRFVAEPPFVVNDALTAASASLPTQVWAVISAGVSGSPSMGWASAFVLLMVVLSFYAVGITARTIFRRKLDYE
ncbi:phosphate ABC transporter permease PstA [Halorubellus sp. JP-L1]|uniref:phosphate ABC transporter permease PstA n=1 Tax=Halorubellus sp. JP-L1 TaxID=2715753 RepID=UPI00140B222C|nr:phosphate ABC transporter permease PstA [Halorubellus sp. JP-L1]NHN41136.1 phosphate ABC transporter permease PstA [Halorubellus sp. JP-L1]